MTLGEILLAAHLVTLTGPNGQAIILNADQVVSMRTRRDDDHFAKGVKCLIHTSDGKFVTVLEDCDTVREAFDRTYNVE